MRTNNEKTFDIVNYESNVRKGERNAILSRLDLREETSPILSALISPALLITEATIEQMNEWLNDYNIFTDGDLSVYVCFNPEAGKYFYEVANDAFAPEGFVSTWNQMLYSMAVQLISIPGDADGGITNKHYDGILNFMEAVAKKILGKTKGDC